MTNYNTNPTTAAPDSRPTPAMSPGVPTGEPHDAHGRGSDGERSLRDRLSEGTEHLSEAARERVVRARSAAVDAQRQARRAMHDGSDAAADMFDRQPLVVGALAFAVGAAVAAMLPRTRTENSYMGARRDSLMDEAERVFHEETERARAALKSVEAEARSAAKDVADTAAQKAREATDEIASKAKSAADDVRETAEKEGKDVAKDAKQSI